MGKFLIIMQLLAMTMKITGKDDLDDLEIGDLTLLFADDQWVAVFKRFVEIF